MSVETVASIVHTISETIVKNEDYFGELDSVVGDGDFGYSLARGFEKVIEEFDTIDRTDSATFLRKTGMIVMSRCGGTSGPLWGTAFIRAAGVLAGKDTVEPEDAVKVLRAAFDGISQRGGASLGDKTLLDALGPMADRLEEELKTETPQVAFTRAVETAKSAAEATANLQAKRGRASYSGERSVGSADAGALAVAVICDAVAKAHAA
jgi:dihydroxyacetone kinase-like protein